MDAKLFLITAGIVLACFVLGLLLWRGRRPAGPMIVQRSPLAPVAMRQSESDGSPGGMSDDAPGGANVGINVQLGRDVEKLLSAGEKIQAVVLVLRRTGLGIQEAKDVVDKLDALRKRLGG